MTGPLTELESTALAVVAQSGPCTTYALRKAFARSVTAQWSASAGTLYPVIARLNRLKFVTAQRRADDGRGSQVLAATAAGRARVASWVMALGPAEADSVPDPVRTRLHFLELLPPSRRAHFLKQALKLTDAAIVRTRAFLAEERANSEFDYLASLGGLYQLQARRKWLSELTAALRRRSISNTARGLRR